MLSVSNFITNYTNKPMGRKEIEMMTIEEMKEYLLAELKEEREKMLKKQGSNYSYIFMLCNDMGLIDPAEY